MKFKVGDVCLTQGSRFPVLNNNQLVVIVSIDRSLKTDEGECAPYLIRRIDGLPHPSTRDVATGLERWYHAEIARCPGRMLRKPKAGDLPGDLHRVYAEPERVAA